MAPKPTTHVLTALGRAHGQLDLMRAERDYWRSNFDRLKSTAESHLVAWQRYSAAVQRGDAAPLEITGEILRADSALRRAVRPAPLKEEAE